MEKDEYIKACRYYKGEVECPFEPKEGDNKPILWWCERSWCRDMELVGESAFSHDVEEYNCYHVGEKISSDMPITLLARIFNRFAKGCYTMASAAEDFVGFYAEWYGQPSAARIV